MKTTLLSILAITGISALSFGQVVTMEIGASGDISGTEYTVTSAGAEVVLDVHVANLTANSMDLTITRDRINPQTNWTDYVCWGHETDPFGGVCYPFYAVSPWTTPTAVTIDQGEGGSLAIHINPLDPDFGCVVYRYYVMDGSVAIDSLDISVCKTAAIEEVSPVLTVSVSPNPANSYVTVKTNGVDGATVGMVDVLGNVVMKETFITASKTINVSNFRNGIYFVTVEAKGAKTINRKIIVRH
ncbi:MAG: hypothetical protein ACI837_000048 [Crocinitomicaceae bacterium]|jgi:hypothetical protein